MSICRTLAVIVFCTLFALPALAYLGTVVVAKTGPAPLLLWDATTLITQVVQNKQPREAALRDLESQAMQILGQHARGLKHVKFLTIRVLYQKTGAVSPIYGTATFEGVERVFELTAFSKDARAHAKELADAIARGTIPRGVRLSVTGALPPL